MHRWQVPLAGDSEGLIGHLSVTFGGAPNFDVADSLGWCLFWTVLDDLCLSLGPFGLAMTFNAMTA